MLDAKDEFGKLANPYKDGPSALEKAAHLFFFTEIVRGKLETRLHFGRGLTSILRHVACAGTVFQTAIHHYVSV